jgi:aspartate/methionine/tyrosine aminotransferase
MILRRFPPMGVYETLFRFAEVTSKYMGDAGTHPWAQGFPLTSQIPGGPPLPASVSITAEDRMYPKADGQMPLRQAIADYYRRVHNANITYENVAVFAGGRPGIFAILSFLLEDWSVAVEETEYTPYYDILKLLRRPHQLIPSNRGNRFRPGLSDHPEGDRVFMVRSNPLNPTGVTIHGDELQQMVDHYSQDNRGALFDEAYEWFTTGAPVSALAHIKDIEATNLFVCGAATKGLQVPGMRVGWVVSAKRHVEAFRNYSSFGMGGVSRASQLYVTELLESERATQAQAAIASYYTSQRDRYAEGLKKLGLELFSGDGGFYHWLRLPDGLSGDAFNERLMKHNAAVMPGRLCDMARRGDHGAIGDMIRFSFGPLKAESYESDMEILAACLK